ncbi:MAG: GntR family transcriptional regulator [Treponema sp.]|jgi:DNA-binding LacI/PurR family transcriptional regulator|nr:GntR family transcriptional regulator [Treponema sp.]
MKTQPYYRHVYDFLLDAIKTGNLAPGDKLPAEKELCAQFSISRITSKRALELLTEQGYVTRFPGKGSFVAKQLPPSDGVSRGLSRDSRTIGYVVSDFSDNFGTRLLFTIEQVCRELGYSLILKRSRDSVSEEAAAIASLIALGVDGLLVLPIHGEYYNEEILKLILAKKPLAFVDRRMRGLSAPSFSTDNTAAARTGAEYLLNLGHRNIAFYSGPIKNTSTVEDRRNGFVDAYAGKGIPINEGLFCTSLISPWTYPFSEKNYVAQDIEKVKAHLAEHPEISAAFAAEYNMAVIVRAAAEGLGRNIPGDFSILTFDSPPSITGIPLFTHLLQDEEAIGRNAVEALHAMISGQADCAAQPSPLEAVIFPAALIPGLSTHALRSAAL